MTMTPLCIVALVGLLAPGLALPAFAQEQEPAPAGGKPGTGLPGTGYCLKTTGGPLTRAALRLILTSTRSAILMKGMPLVIPYSFRSKAMVPRITPEPVPLPSRDRCKVSGLETPRMVNVPWTSKVSGPVCIILVERKRDQRILINVEEIVALQRPILESAPGIHAGCLDLHV